METGHTKNISNFLSFIGYLAGWGTDYKPVNPAIALAVLQALHPTYETAVKAVDDQKKIFDDLKDKRKIVFNTHKPLATRVVNSFSSLNLPQETIDGAISINLKIQGRRASPKKDAKPDDPNAPKYNSSSQQSFDLSVKYFHDLITWVSQQPAYLPNEADLKVANLNSYYGKLDSTNKAVIAGKIPYDNKLDARDTLLYAPETGMLDLVKAVKKYAISAFGTRSPRYKQISGIKFNKPRNR